MCGKFDEDQQSNWTFTKKLLMIVIFIMIIYFIILLLVSGGSPVNTVRCNEMIILMIDDPDHERLHGAYPLIMSDLHNFMEEKCMEVRVPSGDIDNRINIKDGS